MSTLSPGDRVVRWINNLTLTDEFKGERMRLRPYQEAFFRAVFGTLRPDGRRQYRKAFLFIPRKNTKTQLAACAATYSILGEGKQGQEVICGASDRNQAGKLFSKCVSMIEADRYLSSKCRIYETRKRIVCPRSENVLEVISGEGRRNHGGNPSMAILDELHAQRDRRLYDAMTSGSATRKEPLVLVISTAGEDHAGLCRAEFKYALGVKQGKIINPAYLPILYHADQADDWRDERTWFKAMPGLGDIVSLESIRDEFRLACEMPTEEAKFKSYYLNLFVGSEMKWLNAPAWALCGEHRISFDRLRGRACYAGLDLSNTSDMTAFVLVFPMDDGSLEVLAWFWIPRVYAERRSHADGLQYLTWAKRGLVTLTEGEVIDYDQIKTDIIDIVDLFDLRELRMDPWNGMQIAVQLQAEGLPVKTMRQGTISMNDPVKALGVLVARGLLHHGANPVLDWQAGNVCTATDGHGNVKFSKASSAEKIDGMVCLAMGVAGAIEAEPEIGLQIIRARESEGVPA